jgi:glutathione S-transferase
MLALYGHHFSSYTWKALIPLYAYDIPFEFRAIDGDHLENIAVIQRAGPLGKFPVLEDDGALIFEATTILEHLARHHGADRLIPADPDAAIRMRMLDRVFDNYVMGIMQSAVGEVLRPETDRDIRRVEEVRERLPRVYRWLESWLETYRKPDHVTLIECAAAPSLFYADWVQAIGDDYPRLQAWRAHLLALPAVKRCVDDARPYRVGFPLGAPDRD